MPRFIYKAVAAGGEVLDGEITAENREAAMARIRAQGVVPVSCCLCLDRRCFRYL